MVHCLWSKPDQLDLVKEMVSAAIRKHGYSMAVNLNMLKREISEFETEVDKEIKVKYTESEVHPLPVQEDYYQLEKQEQKFEGSLITIKQYHKLRLDEQEVINIYDEDLELRNRLKAQRSNNEHSVDVFHNSVKYTLPLKTKKVEKTKIVYKAPHSIVEEHWDNRLKKLQSYIHEQKKRLDDNPPEALKGIERHLFVDPELSEIVKANLDEVKSALDNLLLRLEKLQYAYVSIE